MSEEILRIKSPIGDNITNLQYHTYTPYTTSYNNNDEVRIAIQAQDLYVLPSQSYLQIDFSVTENDNEAIRAAVAEAAATAANLNNPLHIAFVHGFISHLFSEIRYELNGIEIDKCVEHLALRVCLNF